MTDYWVERKTNQRAAIEIFLELEEAAMACLRSPGRPDLEERLTDAAFKAHINRSGLTSLRFDMEHGVL